MITPSLTGPNDDHKFSSRVDDDHIEPVPARYAYQGHGESPQWRTAWLAGRGLRPKVRIMPSRYDTYIQSDAPTEFLQRRPFPLFRSTQQQAESCLAHLFAVADRAGIQVYVMDEDSPDVYEIGLYSFDFGTIHLAPALLHDALLRAFVLGHELAHALDPVICTFPHHYEMTQEMYAAEVVAESASLKCLESFGIEIYEGDCYLQYCELQHKGYPWRNALEYRLASRYEAASIHLMNPQEVDPWKYRAQLERSQRRNQSEIRRRSRRERTRPWL